MKNFQSIQDGIRYVLDDYLENEEVDTYYTSIFLTKVLESLIEAKESEK